jgi:hypothetical protein
MKGGEKRRRVHEHLSDCEENALFADGFEDAIIGIGRQFTKPPLVVYDYLKMVAVLMKRDKMSLEEAEEYLSFNVEGAWVGKQTPIILRRVESLE